MTPDGVSRLAGQIVLRDCLQPQQLVATNFSLFPINSNSASWTALTVPEENGLGWIAPGMVEVQQYDDSLLAVRRQLKWFQQGPIFFSTNQTDLAVNGLGFFVLRDPADNTLFATRSGHFQLDEVGHLIATNGWRLQGLTGTNLSEPGDLIVNAAQGINSLIPFARIRPPAANRLSPPNRQSGEWSKR
jgi:flagellar hook protein FlgE